MGKNNNIIEINGKRYDAISGALLSSTPAQATQHVHPSTVVQPTVKPQPAQSIPILDTTPSQPAKPPAKTRIHEAARPSKLATTHKPQPAKTLMRSAVQKPGHSLKRRAKAYGHTDALVEKPSTQLQPKPSVHRLNDKRLQHARQISKSQAVSRFSSKLGPAPAPPTELKPVTPPIHRPIHNPTPTQHHKPHKSPRTTADLLEHALQSATSHEQSAPSAKKYRRKPSRLTSIAAIALSMALLAGFVAYQNLTSVQLHIASAKAGFAASLPNYQPAGYHLSHLNYSPGTVAINFHSNSDDRAYAITEKTSDWDSDALRDSFLASSGQQYQTVESAGRTLFIYGQNAATWVSGGVWYQVQSNGTLSNRQLVQLATSM